MSDSAGFIPQPKSAKQNRAILKEVKEVIVVTGASAGVGRAIVRKLARPGVCLGLLARGQAGLDATCREVEQAGAQALALSVDVGDPKQVFEAARQIEEKFGPIDIWINNAMASVFAPVKEMLPEEYQRVTDVTYLGYVYGTQAALKSMLPRDKGVIVQVGSALAYRGIPLQSAYCAAKHAVEGFHDSLITELKHDKSKVKVTMVQLPAVNTPQFGWVLSRLPRKGQPVPPIFQPEVIAEAIVYAAYHPRREVYVGWPALKTIIGNKIAPWYADLVLARNGYESQQTKEPRDPAAPNNLWRPVDTETDYGAHGAFDSRAKNFSLQTWLNMHRPQAALLGSGLLAAAAAGTGAFLKGFKRQ